MYVYAAAKSSFALAVFNMRENSLSFLTSPRRIAQRYGARREFFLIIKHATAFVNLKGYVCII